MYFTREEQLAPEPIQASRTGSVQASTTEETTNDYSSSLPSSVFSGPSGDSRRNGATQILRSSVLSSRFNSGNRALSLSVNSNIRGVALRQVQRSHGNQFVQRALIQRKTN